jgi:hypothetical protein
MYRISGVVLLALAIAPTSIRAEPIRWEYSSTLAASNGKDYFVAGALDAGTMVLATLAGGNPPTTATGMRTFSLGSISGAGLVTPDAPGAPQFDATIKVVDDASGKSGTLTFGGGSTGNWIDSSQGTYSILPFLFKHDDFLTLGQHRYEVHVTDDLNATVTPSQLAETPEPAAWLMALIGLGLAGLCCIWRTRLCRAPRCGW